MKFNILKSQDFYFNDKSFYELYSPILGAEANGFYNWLLYASNHLTNDATFPIGYDLIKDQTHLSIESINKNFDKLMFLGLIKMFSDTHSNTITIKILSPLVYSEFIKLDFLVQMLKLKTSQTYFQMLEFKNKDFLNNQRFSEINKMSTSGYDLFKSNFVDQIKLELYNEYNFKISSLENSDLLINEIINKNKLSFQEAKQLVFESLVLENNEYFINISNFINLIKNNSQNVNIISKTGFSINRDRDLFFSSKDISLFDLVINDYNSYEPDVYLASIKKENLTKNDWDAIKLLVKNNVFEKPVINMILDFCLYKTNGLLHLTYLQKLKTHLIANNSLRLEEIINHFRHEKTTFSIPKTFYIQTDENKTSDEHSGFEDQFKALNK